MDTENSMQANGNKRDGEGEGEKHGKGFTLRVERQLRDFVQSLLEIFLQLLMEENLVRKLL